MKTEHVLALIRAHHERNEERFRVVCLQIAAQCAKRSPLTAERITRIANAKMASTNELPGDSRKVLEPLPVLDPLVELPTALRLVLDEIVAEHRHQGILAARGLAPRTRVLMHGPPGNGKTAAASYLAQALGVSGFVAPLTTLRESHRGDSARNIRAAMGALETGRLLLLDEIDAVGVARSDDASGAGKEDNATVSSLLMEIDRVRAQGMLVATTNRVDLLDPALLRRFDRVVEVPGPSELEAAELVKRLAHEFGVGVPSWDKHWDLDCASYASIRAAVEDVARRQIIAEAEAQGDLFGGAA